MKIEKYPVNLSTIAHMLDKKPKSLYTWYREVISDYKKDIEEGKYSAKTVFQYDEETAEVEKEQLVNIFKPENVGTSMMIDEKMIGGKYTVIFSNQETGKIAMLIDTMKPTLIKQALQLFGNETLSKIKNVCSDMSPMMKKIIKETIPTASNTIDKFHVIKHIIDALNAERLKIKKSLQQSNQISRENPNGWTDIEFLEKCRYWLYQRESENTLEQKEYLDQLFEKFPTLQLAVKLTEEIRSWYDKKNIGLTKSYLEKMLDKWIVKVEESKLTSFKFLVKMFEKHWDGILGYFQKGQTSAKAENINGRIQRFLMNSYGTRDRHFFFYRVQVYFS